MESFLAQTAKHILETYPQPEQLCIVLPNRRAGLFFRKHFGLLVDKPTWMPEVLTIEDLFYDLAGKSPADDLTLIFELYKVYQSLQPEAETFDRFYFWAEIILKDFNDLDQFMADADKLYHHLSEIKEIEADWSFLSEEQVALIKRFWLSFEEKSEGHQEKFLKFWQILRPLYRAFQSALEVQGLWYQGKIYRYVTERLKEMPLQEKEYAFVGFNAFTETEKRLVRHFVKEYQARVYWDIDQFYFDQAYQEAGLFFREYRRDPVLGLTFPEEVPNSIKTRNIKFHSYASALKINQSNLVGALLEEIPTNESLEETVVILPDEQLLFPVLHALPPNIDKVNVTMGYPVKNAPVYAFLESILELQRYVKVQEGQVMFYHLPVLRLLSSVYLKNENPKFIEEISEEIKAQNKIYLSEERLKSGGAFFELIFQKLPDHKILSFLSVLMQELARKLSDDSLQRSYLHQCFKQLNRLREILIEQEQESLDKEFFIRLFRQIFREVKLPFEGEPLQGLQLMGVLESRNLDFKRLIICNMNEGSFPPGAAINSMVPFNIRKAFGLPIQEQNDAIYAYTFYRLLHLAEEVHLIYSTSNEQGKASEKSRYIEQLALELGQEIPEKSAFVPVALKELTGISIEKTPAILDLMDRYVVDETGNAKTAFSPSALSVYLDCRLKFYLQYIAGLNENEEVKEEVDSAVFGSLTHYSMEILYEGFINRKQRKVLEKGDFQELKKNWLFPAVEGAIRKFYHLKDEDDTRLSGQLLIVRGVLQRYLERVLEMDEHYAPFKIISMEKEYFTHFPIQTPKGKLLVKIKGYIDRVDEKEEKIRLIDYKSGKDEKVFGGIPSLFDREHKKRNKAAMQTMIYGLLFQSFHPDNPLPLKPALFNFREIFNADFNPYLQSKVDKTTVEVEDYKDYSNEFEEALRKLLEEIFDPDVAFSQTEDLEKCKYCNFKEICGR